MLIPHRHDETGNYRYGFNGKENDDEVKGEGNSIDFGARMYDPRVGRWFKMDPLVGRYPHLSSYNFAANSPLQFIDPDGKKIIIYYRTADGKERQFEYKPGIKPPNNKFVQNTVQMLDKLIKIEGFKNIEIEGSTNPNDRLNEIINSEKTLHLVEITDKSNNSSTYVVGDYVANSRDPQKKELGKFDVGDGFGSIKVNDEYGIEYIDDGKTYTNSPTAQLAHELVHTIHENECPIETQARRNTPNIPVIGNEEEKLTVKESNQINKKLNEPKRKDYRAEGGMVKTQSPTSNKKKPQN